MTPQEWSSADLVAALAAIGVILTAWRQYRIERRQATNTSWIDRESLVDDRINAHLLRLDGKVAELEAQNQGLEVEVNRLRQLLDQAIAYINRNDLPWPPPEPTN